MLWLYIDFPSLQLDCLQSGSPISPAMGQSHINEQAIIIVDSKKNHIVQLNESAKAKGIQLGMGLGMAASLAHDLCVVPYQMTEEEAYLLTLAEQLYSVTANIALFPPHGLALKVGDMLQLYQHLSVYIEGVSAVLTPFNLKMNLACGYSVMSAQLLACAGVNLITTDQNIMTKKSASLSIEQLFITDKAKSALARLGFKTLAQLQALPIKEFAKRLDRSTMEYLAQLKGQADKSLLFYQPKNFFEYSVELLYEMINLDVLLQPIKQLLKLLEAYLLRRDYVCLQLEFCLYHRVDGLSHVLQQSLIISSATGEYLAVQWLKLVSLKLTNIKLLAPITKVSLLVEQFQPNTGEINDIFLGKRGQLSFAQLASLLVNKLGNEKVLRLQQGNDHRAELASCYSPFINHSINKVEKKNVNNGKATSKRNEALIANSCATHSVDKNLLRPSFILAEPEPLLSNISVLHGPERISTAWWEQSKDKVKLQNSHDETITGNEAITEHGYQRDYFVAKNAQGQCCWVYRELNHQWYIHGYFS
jgi:protein ImuB